VSFGAYGDQLELTSIVFTIDTPTSLTFDYYLEQDGDTGGGKLTVYLLAIQQSPLATLFESDSTTFNQWLPGSACIPPGTYQIMFQATIGLPFKSDVNLDNVVLGGDCMLEESLKGAKQFST